jgi:hypothetical protein
MAGQQRYEFWGHNGWGSFWVTSMLASDDAEFNSSQNNSVSDVQDVDALNLKPNNRFIYTVYAEDIRRNKRAILCWSRWKMAEKPTDAEKKALCGGKIHKRVLSFPRGSNVENCPIVTETAKSLLQTFTNCDPAALLQIALDDFQGCGYRFAFIMG